MIYKNYTTTLRIHKLICENQTRIIVSLIHKLIYELN